MICDMQYLALLNECVVTGIFTALRLPVRGERKIVRFLFSQKFLENLFQFFAEKLTKITKDVKNGNFHEK
jgi:hypothetical protein